MPRGPTKRPEEDDNSGRIPNFGRSRRLFAIKAAAVIYPKWSECTTAYSPRTSISLSPYVRDFPGSESPLRSTAAYSSVEKRSQNVVMRDGAILKTDVYIPRGVSAAPVIIIRTPYNSEAFHPSVSRAGTVALLTGHGYIAAVQNVRGKHRSDFAGEYTPSIADDTDTYDTMVWASEQDWFDGNIGTMGCSYLGESQVMAARDPHPAWRAAIPMASGGANFNVGGRDRPFGVWNGDALELAQTLSWFLDFGGSTPANLGDSDRLALMETLPVVDALKRAGIEGTDYEAFVSNPPSASPYWDKFPYLREGDTIKVPSLFIETWYDYGPQDVVSQFNLARAFPGLPPDMHRLVMGPTTHCEHLFAMQRTVVGARNLEDARFDYQQIYLDWFDRHLRNTGPKLSDIPVVQSYLMGANRWETLADWPPPGSAPRHLFLSQDRGLADEPATQDGSVSYIYDPMNPVPTVGSPVCCVPEIDGNRPDGAFDQARLDNRSDIIRFQTPVLEEDLIVSGPVEVVVYVSSTAVDTDFTAKLIDVYPDGRAFNILDGIQRMRWRLRSKEPVFMKQDTVYEVRIHLQATSNMFKAGHKLRIDISSSNFPRFDRNMNVHTLPSLATSGVTASNTIYFSRHYRSRVELMVGPPPS